jgi:pentatricopeptide repeat protein
MSEAMKLFDSMVEEGCTPDVVTYNTLINELCKGGKMDKVLKLMDEMLERGLVPTKFTYTSLIHGNFK